MKKLKCINCGHVGTCPKAGKDVCGGFMPQIPLQKVALICGYTTYKARSSLKRVKYALLKRFEKIDGAYVQGGEAFYYGEI